MNPKFSLSIILTIGAFVLTLYLFVVVAIAHDKPGADAADAVIPFGGQPWVNVQVHNPRVRSKARSAQAKVAPSRGVPPLANQSLGFTAALTNPNRDPGGAAIL